MRNIRDKISLIIRTFNTLGYTRIILKSFFALRLKIFSFLPKKLSLFLIGFKKIRLKFKNDFTVLNQKKVFEVKEDFSFTYIDIYLIDDEYRLHLPIIWDKKNWPRLLNFYLHYFDWIRDYIDSLLNNKTYNLGTSEVNYLIESWIANNNFAKGDGWYPYTTSLRIVNWSILFQLFPSFVSEKRIKSLWTQLIWLNSNLEKAQGGNHLIENLIAISIVSIQFDNDQAENIFRNSQINLKSQLKLQILCDGGHYERSATYHTILLDKLIELACFISIAKGSVPSWLNNKIEEMSNWLKKVTFINGKLPRFNDSALNSAPEVNKVNSSADTFLKYSKNLQNTNLDLLKNLLIKKAFTKSNKKGLNFTKNLKVNIPEILDLPDTGWVIFNPGKGWQACFKNGVATSLRAPGHCQSDILSFDLLYGGEYIFVDAGTSEYQAGAIRTFERSGGAHNVLQVGKTKNNWVEPVEVWNGFKVGKISKNINREYGVSNYKEYFALGSYDSYQSIGTVHNRKIILSEVKHDSIKLKVEDEIRNKNKIFCRLIFHLGPKINPEKIINSLTIATNPIIEYEVKIDKTSFSEGFGHIQSRTSLYYEFTLGSGHQLISSIIKVENTCLLANDFEESLAN